MTIQASRVAFWPIYTLLFVPTNSIAGLFYELCYVISKIMRFSSFSAFNLFLFTD